MNTSHRLEAFRESCHALPLLPPDLRRVSRFPWGSAEATIVSGTVRGSECSHWSLRRKIRMTVTWLLLIALGPAWVQAKKKKTDVPDQHLSDYIQQGSRTRATESPTLGSLWNPQGLLADMARDYKAAKVGDPVIIRIAEQTSSQTSGTVKTARNLSAQSSIPQTFGQAGAKSGQTNLLSLNSAQNLDGQGAATSSSTLITSLTGVVTQVLSNGYLVIQAARWVEMDNQRQQVVLRGAIRSDDIAPDNSILSTQVANLVVEVAGKGVVSDGTRPPNRVTRLILKLVGF